VRVRQRKSALPEGVVVVRTLRIARDGTWYADETEMERRDIVSLFAAHLERDGQGYLVRLGSDSMRVEVEDVPFVIADVVPAEGGLRARLVDGREVDLPPGPIYLVNDIPYCSLRWERDTKVGRGAWWRLLWYLDEKEEVIRYGEKAWPLVRPAG